MGSTSIATRLAVPFLLTTALLPAAGHGQENDAEAVVCLNSLGYFPESAKHASIHGRADGDFTVIRVGDDQVVHTGVLTAAPSDDDDEDEDAEDEDADAAPLGHADFSAVKEPGEYQIDIPGLGRSPTFHVAQDLYRDPFRTVVRGMYLWRCGTAVSGEHDGHTFAHEACHLEDAYLDSVGGGHVRADSVKGWHDAGDYNKYVVNSGVTVGVMFRAWEDFQGPIQAVSLGLPEAGGALPEYLAEMKWQMDWLLTMQADDGSAYHKVSTKRFGGMILPEDETEDRYFVPWGTNATADLAAMCAQASRHFRPYDAAYADRCLATARKAYDFLVAHPEPHRANQRGFSTGGYESDDWDDRLWAEAEVWEATGDAAALAALESRLKTAAQPSQDRPDRSRRRRGGGRSANVDVDFDWGNVKNLGLLTYLFSKREGRDAALVEQIRASLIAAADVMVSSAASHAYARPLGDRYSWGCNGAVARQTVVLEAAFRLTGDAKYRGPQRDAINYLFGRNPYGRSFVTGMGHRPPMHPHDRRSAGGDVVDPWPGYLVGGAHPGPLDWQDEEGDYRTNEIAINWNAALIYALAAQLEPRDH